MDLQANENQLMNKKYSFGVHLGAGLTGWNNSYINENMQDIGGGSLKEMILDSKKGFIIGVFGSYDLASFIKLDLSINYMHHTFGGTVGNDRYFLQAKSHMIKVPLLVKIKLFKGLYFNVGPEFIYRINSTMEESPTSKKKDLKQNEATEENK